MAQIAVPLWPSVSLLKSFMINVAVEYFRGCVRGCNDIGGVDVRKGGVEDMFDFGEFKVKPT